MNATAIATDSSSQLATTLSAVYAAHAPALRKRVALATSERAHAWDVVQEAFLHVLDHPPSNVSPTSLAAALDGAVRAACRRESRRRADDAQMRIALRKRSL
jgi:DNA-directed RNA polymerase specialized sigma24 family protein